MLTRLLGGSDLRLSAVGFGAWAIGGRHWGDDVDDDRSRAAIRRALDLGVNWFDTAPLYGDGHADTLLAETLRGHDVVIASKVGVMRGGHPRSCLRPDHVVADAEASLRRLQRDRIDLLQVHWPCEDGTPLEDTIDALQGLRRRGLVRWFGLCNYDADAIRALAPADGLVSLQTPLSMIRREAEGGLLDACRSAGLGVLAYEPLGRGILTGRYRPGHVFPATDMRRTDPRFEGAWLKDNLVLADLLASAGGRLGLPAAALAVAWAASRPGVTAAIVGCKGPEQVEQNVAADRLLRAPRNLEVLGRLADRAGR